MADDRYCGQTPGRYTAPATMTTAARLRCAGLVAVITVALAGCGGGGNEGQKVAAVTTVPPLETTTTVPVTTTTLPPVGGDTTVPPAPAPTPPAPAAPAPARTVTAAEAEASVLQASDVPADWVTQPAEESLHLDLIWQEVTGCLGLGGLEQPMAWAVSAGYTHGLAQAARTMVQYRSEAANRSISDALAGPGAAQCLLQTFSADVDRSAPEGAVREKIDLASLDLAPLGQQTYAWRISAVLNLNGLKVPVHQDFLVAFKAEAVIPMLFLDVGSPFDSGLERSLAEAVVSRA
ncbi:MAG TPA: hypothetical protein VM121_05600 [Acidimicrobiales bacterium]|nr:hypothetical protein [Acidimicrobiales bacterium]